MKWIMVPLAAGAVVSCVNVLGDFSIGSDDGGGDYAQTAESGEGNSANYASQQDGTSTDARGEDATVEGAAKADRAIEGATGETSASGGDSTEEDAAQESEAAPAVDATAGGGDGGVDAADGSEGGSDSAQCPNECEVNQTCIAGSCSGVCGPSQSSCSGNTPQTCVNGAWQPGTACAGGTPYCNGAGVCGVCKDGTTQCYSGTAYQTCSGGAWGGFIGCPNGQQCSSGNCVATCNSTTCSSGCCNGSTCVAYSSQASNLCGTNGQSCMACSYLCNGAGVCTGVCTPGAKQCTNPAPQQANVQTCDSTGQWVVTDTCSACDGTGTAICAPCDGGVPTCEIAVHPSQCGCP